ncbi:unnamed protein product (macronuclear) [Paramecium tetraurelia]|uniref:TNFR-Cys domain-containing protein n=1 Tax=Paramecium tetraurelia TaxID=5888 RepID=A0D148_PARTE|nr:uncharacterized protein GSPATT00012289001 [Paramecium tetraurelia]CAK76765.1 unnamed protein product [Paramecium tetraurelia]|eukprot:XP_001444162.1 hypothetical protein (macronuclear) [Paramecium tetraurelia strain d4-2]
MFPYFFFFIACHYTCMTCFGPALNNYLTCASSNNREFKTNRCVCQYTYIEKAIGDPMCQSCSYRCANCSGTIQNCTSCPLLSLRDLGNKNSCSCPAKTYDQPGNPICLVCHSSCQKCNGDKSNQCTSCYTQIMRKLDPSGSCSCMSKYYDAGRPECTGIGQNNRQHAVRIAWIVQLLLIIAYLVKQIDTYKEMFVFAKLSQTELPLVVIKFQAEFAVKVAIILAQIVMGLNLINVHNAWLVRRGFYQILVVLVLLIILILASQSVNNAIIGVKLAQEQRLHVYLVIKTLLESLSTRNVYVKRDILITDLILNAKNVTILVFNAALLLQNVFHMLACNCLDSYYDAGEETCAKCHYSCFTCNSSGYKFCQSCIEMSTSFRVFNQGICQCLPGYYDDGISPHCHQCQSQCLTCQNNADYCTSCEVT